MFFKVILYQNIFVPCRHFAGILEVFISRKLIPSDYVYDQIKNHFYNQSLETNIFKGSKTTIRILGVRQTQGIGMKTETDVIQAIGTMKV